MPAMTSILLDTQPFSFHINNHIDLVASNIIQIYPDFMLDSHCTPDYEVSMRAGGGLRRFYKPQARFFCDQREPFLPMTMGKAYAMLEWGLNWIVASHEMQHVIVHAGVLAKGNKAILLPAPPGSGKSTLTSWLAFNGWRLLSDEMALIVPGTNTVVPFVRPVCLKNKSIELAQQWFPHARFSSVASNTHKGDVVHLSPPLESWQQRSKPAKIVGIVYPNFRSEIACDIYPLTQQESFAELVKNAFNYGVMGKKGFDTVVNVIESALSFAIFHNDVAEVQSFLEQDIIAKN